MRGALACIAGLLLSATPLLADGAGQDPTTTHFHQGPCLEQFVGIPIPMAEAMTLTPPGFPPRAFDADSNAPPIPLLATGVTVGYRCVSTVGDGGLNLPEVRTVGRALLVDPPAQFRSPGITNYVIILGGWTSSSELAAVYSSWHLPNVHVGSVDFTVTQDSPNVRHGSVTGSSGEGSLGITTLVAGTDDEQQPDTFRLFGFDGDQVAGYVDWSWPSGSRTIESGAAVQQLVLPGALPDLRLGVSFHYFGAYSYDLAFTPLG